MLCSHGDTYEKDVLTVLELLQNAGLKLKEKMQPYCHFSPIKYWVIMYPWMVLRRSRLNVSVYDSLLYPFVILKEVRSFLGVTESYR